MKLNGPSTLWKACCSRDRREKSDVHHAQQRICQLRWNWMLVMLATIYLYGGWTVTIPTMYQYLTNPANTTCANAGLGESEVIYSIAVAMYSVGELMGSLSSASLSLCTGYSVLFFTGVALQTCGFLIYGLSTAGWMVIVARLLLGIHGGMVLALPPSYFSMSVEEYGVLKETQERKRQSGLKELLIFLWGFTATFGFVCILCFVLVAALFGDLNQFLWIAWFEVACGLALMVLMLLFFRDKVYLPSFSSCNFISRSRPKRKPSTASTAALKPTISQPVKPMVIFTLIYLIFTGYILDCYLSVMETLANPILTDYFGMSSDTQVYFFLGVVSTVPAILVVMSILDRFSVDTRLLALSLFIISTVGLLLLGDWQTISTDPCNNFSLPEDSVSGKHTTACTSASCVPFHLNVSSDCSSEDQLLKRIGLAESTSYVTVYSYADQPWPISDQQTSAPVTVSQCPSCSNFTSGNCLVASVANGYMCVVEDRSSGNGNSYQSYSFTLQNYQSQLCLSVAENVDGPSFSPNCTNLPVNLLILTDSLFSTDALKAEQECESHSPAPDYCYWVQDSIVTGQYCPDCAPLCRSTKKIPHFAQVVISIAFLTIASAAGKFVLYILMVKVSPARFLAVASGVLAFVQGFARLTTPIWGNLVYVAVGRHTLVPVAIMIICQILMYLGLCITWKTLRGTSPSLTNGSGDVPANDVKEMKCSHQEEDTHNDKGKSVNVAEEPIYMITSL